MNNSNFPVYKHNSRSLLVLGLFLLMILGVVNQLPTHVDSARNVTNVALSESSKAVLCSLEDSFSTIAQRVEPGVVSVTSVQSVALEGGPGKSEEPNSLEEFFKHLFQGRFVLPNRGALPHGLYSTPAAGRTVTAAGSGTIVRRHGDKFYVLTNYHVVQDAFRVAVRLADDTDLKGTVVGVDPTTDLAVVEISSPKLSDRNIVPLGDSNSVKVGAWALALGSPFGFEHTLTVGVVSAIQRELDEGD
ncbi:MAG: trypsin-like peptidase domain-containing protein, partial [Armatimonadetes bacterium]|nr:trypsin-like peptidase domain-containing protein [Armatimonadota bacterium]